MKTDINVPTVRNKQRKLRNKTLLLLASRKPLKKIRIRIRIKMLRKKERKCYGSGTLVFHHFGFYDLLFLWSIYALNNITDRYNKYILRKHLMCMGMGGEELCTYTHVRTHHKRCFIATLESLRML